MQKTEQTLTPLPTPAEQERQQRTQQLVTLLMHKKNMTQACTEVGISRTTGYEYWKQWQETEEATYINTEWWSLYQQVKRRSPVDALRMLTQLKLRFHPEKIEFKGEMKEKIIVATIDLNKMNENDRCAILAAEEAITRAEGNTGT
jgi:hypothetical protein